MEAIRPIYGGNKDVAFHILRRLLSAAEETEW